MKNKKILIIVLSLIIGALIILGALFAICKNNENDKSQIIEVKQEDLKSYKLYNKIMESAKDGYTFTIKADNNNKIVIVVKDDKAYQEETINGKTTKYIVKNGNTYLLSEDSNVYYTYQNNTAILTKITDALEYMQSTEYIAGTEKIERKKYDFEKYEQMANFLMNYKIIGDNEIGTTTLYFNGDELKYIKTTGIKGEELSKVSINYKADEKLFEIPAEYKDASESASVE